MKKPFSVRLETEVLENFSKFAAANGLEPTQAGAQVIKLFSDVLPQFAPQALGAIPPDWKRSTPGRPRKAARSVSEAPAT